MPKINENAYRRGPLLIKIETCPKTGKAEPCSEDCTRQCLEKSYTIFDPKPPRRRSHDSQGNPESVPVILFKKSASMNSSKSSPAESARSLSKDSPAESFKTVSPKNSPTASAKNSSKDSPVDSFKTVSPKNSPTESIKISPVDSIKTVSPKSSPIPSIKSPVKSVESFIEKRNEQPIAAFPKSQEQSKPPTILTPLPQRYHGPGCALEICISEKHDRNCPSWKPSDKTENSMGEYRVIARQVIRICTQPPMPKPPPPKPPPKCVCEKSTNVNKFISCPICSHCPCHTKKKKVAHIPLKESISKPDSFIFITPSEPETFIESEGSRKSTNSNNLPIFREMPIKHFTPSKKRPFFIRCFIKDKKKNAKKTNDLIKKKNCPQCPEPTTSTRN